MSLKDPTEKWFGPAVDGQEAARRLRSIAQMRNFFLLSRQSIKLAWERGEYPYKPPYDIRSDVEYWKRLAAKKDL